MNNETTTVIGAMVTILESHTTSRLVEIAQECQRRDAEAPCVDTRLIKYASIEVIEARNPSVVPMLEAWANDMDKNGTYVDQLVEALTQIGEIK